MTIGKFAFMTAALVTTGAGTFNLTPSTEFGPLTLDLTVDGDSGLGDSSFGPSAGHGGNRIEIEFVASQFASIAAATAAEVAAVINAAAAAQAAAGQPASVVATVVSSTHVQIATVGVGKFWSLEVAADSTSLTALSLTAGIVTGTGEGDIGAMPSAPVFHDVLSFTGDTSYPSGGTLGFGAAVSAFFKDGRQVIAVIGQDCGGYVPVYVPGTDALKVYQSSDSGSAAPMAEVGPTTNLSGTTFNVLVISA